MARSTATRIRLLTVAVVTTVAVSVVAGVSASAAPPPGVSMKGTGPQPSGLGLFSKATLAQEHCSKNGRMWFSTEGTGPYCVNPWPERKNNGGSTTPGVTATEVKVVVYYSDSPQAATFPQQVDDTQAAYQYASDTFHTYQLWGRKPVYEMVQLSGSRRNRAACRRTQGDRDEAVHGHGHLGPVEGRADLCDDGRQRQDSGGQLLDDTGSRCQTEPLPLELRPGPDRQRAVDRGVRRAIAVGEDGELRGRQGVDVEEAGLRGHLSPEPRRHRRVREAVEGERWRAREGGRIRPGRSHENHGGVAHPGLTTQGCGRHQRHRVRRSRNVRANAESGGQPAVFPRVDHHRVRLHGLRRVRPRLRPGADEAHVRDRFALALQRPGARGRHGEVARRLQLVLGRHDDQDERRRIREPVRLQRASLRGPEVDGREREEGLVRRASARRMGRLGTQPVTATRRACRIPSTRSSGSTVR